MVKVEAVEEVSGSVGERMGERRRESSNITYKSVFFQVLLAA